MESQSCRGELFTPISRSSQGKDSVRIQREHPAGIEASVEGPTGPHREGPRPQVLRPHSNSSLSSRPFAPGWGSYWLNAMGSKGSGQT